MSPVPPPRWTDEQFDEAVNVALEAFRDERLQEPLELYLEAFDQYRGDFEDLLETTVDLTELTKAALDVLTDERFLEAVRYLGGPPISTDDLKSVAEASLAASRLQEDEDMAKRVIETVLMGLDRHRFPWVAEGREPTEEERNVAAVASAALMATQRVRTIRANQSKDAQEEAVKQRLRELGMDEVVTRTITNHGEAPAPGQFCGESQFGTRKADIVVRLYDHQIMPIECKVSNSSTNSIKRLNNDAAVKAKTWITEFGTGGVVPIAVLSGVFKTLNLRRAQNDGLTIIWAHDLDTLAKFIETTKEDDS